MNQIAIMKAGRPLLAATLVALSVVGLPRALAQEVTGSERVVAGPISTGSVISIDQRDGLMVIQSAETGGPITFYGMNKARVETKTGRAAAFADVRPQTPVTVHYTPVEGRWYVGKVIIPESQTEPAATATATGLTAAEQKALNSKAANDGDITTKPGVKARIDSDITTQPGKKDPRDPDVTKKTDK
jgi:hypothetical protein